MTKYRSKFSRRGYLFISFSRQRASGARVGSIWFSQRIKQNTMKKIDTKQMNRENVISGALRR